MSLPFNLAFSGISSGLQTKNATAGGGGVGGWVELGRTTLGSTSDTISVASLADKRYLMLLHSGLNSGSINVGFRFNSDSGNNYNKRANINGGSETTSGATSNCLEVDGGQTANPRFGVGYIANYATKEKLGFLHGMYQSTAGAANAPARIESFSKWANTTDRISSIQGMNFGSGDFASGSEVVVLGYDPADTHTNNFWTELASVNWSSGATIDSGVFTAKKYLWIQAYLDSDTTAGYDRIRVGNATIDTAANYSGRYSIDGGADGTQVSSADNFFPSDGSGTASRKTFTNIFVVNNSANEKLFIGSSIFYFTAGAGTAPRRTEWVMKWANTSNQINRVDFNRSAGNYEGSTTLRVWGSD